MYNVKLIKYASGGYQVRVFDNPVPDPAEETTRKDAPKKSRQPLLRENPFTGEYERILTFEEHDRSVKNSVNRTVNNVYYLTRSNVWDWFVTLTFDPQKVDSLDYDCCVKKLSKWLKRCKEDNPNMRYLVVPEKHKSGRYHFHGLFADCDCLNFTDSGKTVKGQVIYNIGKYHLGFTTATRVQDTERVSKYITKYITKEMCEATPNKKRYWASRNLEKAEMENYLIPGEDMETFLDSLEPYIQYSKRVSTEYQTTTYLELTKEFTQ